MADGNGEDEAARAFEGVRGELALLRRAVERLAAERADDSHAPDYSETLGVIANNITATAQRVNALIKSPALELTPEEMNRQIAAAGSAGRAEDRRAIGAARQTIEEVATKLGRHLDSHIMANEQRRRLWRVGLAGLVAGMALWAILAGPIARSLAPELAAAGAYGGAHAADADVGRRAAVDAGWRSPGVHRRAGGQPAGDEGR